ncbi:splicing factor 3b subunit [Theileria orientalis strain Shintoku]|uniref:Splicing factor 3b subunit n=1 Tax=Theileria orientalis strain Shintoku TaxID=869250 RepID=J7M4N7_THEOR|nr:splicing factor 3b subunit [Theileria orientalis strain Shintoku]PVC51746.1 splicing factor 3b subunit [Theileria orientalis]BAM42350.1 splicing factor 3b subunit [Theileria orientalis strain Shintoku]|eukprot:XP_009692651.1 splicing factor 3b subunit [Theileria orientalis strain Shintoku]
MPVLYHLTLKKPTGITTCVQGSFSAPKAQEIVVARSHILELYSLDSNGKLQTVASAEVFGIVRAISAFRLTGSQKDYLVVGSDSGKLVILEFSLELKTFKRVHCETYGKTGVRRIVPGQYLGVDPKGRAVMVGAVERQKFVYIMNRDSKANLTISSPLEAHKSHSVCFDLVGLEVGFENPIFASIEQSYENVDSLQIDLDEELTDEALKKGVSFWEMDLGLNHVVKKVTLPVDLTAHMLVPVPGGPGGVIVCCENFLVYKNLDHGDVYCAYPRRLEVSEHAKLLITSYAVHKMKDFFFILLQSEYGDLYKVDLNYDDAQVKEIVVRYFDTVELATSMCILRSGYLFVASEFGDHHVYQFTDLGSNEKDPMCTSLHPHSKSAIIAFKPRVLQNLYETDKLPSLSSIVDMKVVDVMGTGDYEFIMGCGRWYNSRLKSLRYGLSTEELAFNELPGRPRAVFTIKSLESNYDEFIIVSFQGNTLVLSIGEAVEEVTDSFFLTSITTLHSCYMSNYHATESLEGRFEGGVSDGIFVQVHDSGFRYSHGQVVKEWKVPSTKRVKLADNNLNQLLLVLSGGEVVYFELVDNDLEEVAKRNLSTEITCVALQHTPASKAGERVRKGEFCCVGSIDNIIRVLKLDKTLKMCSSQLLSNNALPESLALVTAETGSGSGGGSSGGLGESESYLYVGLNNGILIRNNVDSLGNLSDQESRFMGTKAVKLKLVHYLQRQCLLLMTTKTYIVIPNYPTNTTNNMEILPLHLTTGSGGSYGTTVDSIDTFNSLLCLNGFVCIMNNNLKIFKCIVNDDVFSESSVDLDYTPRKLVLMPSEAPSAGSLNYLLALVETDHNSYSTEQAEEINKELSSITLESDCFELKAAKNYRAGPGKWSSCVRIVNPMNLETVVKLLFTENEAATTAYTCVLNNKQLLVVATVKNVHLYPQNKVYGSSGASGANGSYGNSGITGANGTNGSSGSSGFSGSDQGYQDNDEVEGCIRVYEYNSNYSNLATSGMNIKLLHVTNTKGWIRCFNNYENKLLLCAIGTRLRMYALGKKQLLLKGEHRSLTNYGFMDIKVIGSRIYCGDIRESVQLLRIKFYGEETGEFEMTATSTGPRWLSTMELLDYSTVMAADKFDSVFVARVPNNEDVVRNNYFEYQNQFHLSDLVTSLSKVKLNSVYGELVVYSTILGSLGAFVTFTSKDEVDFLQHLEMLLANELDTLSGREAQMHRSYYFPVQNVIDGDLCELYFNLSSDLKAKIANQLNVKVAEVVKKLKNIRNRVF